MTRTSILRLATLAVAVAAGAFLASNQSTSAASGPKPLSTFDPQVKQVLAQMTLDEKIGQMTQPEQDALKDPADIENLFIGSVLSGGNSDPKEGNSLKAWTDLYDRIQTAYARNPPRDPAPLRRRRRARAQQRARRRDLPAQHRPGLHAQSGAGGEGRAHHGRGSARHRHPVGLRSLRDRARRTSAGAAPTKASRKIPQVVQATGRSRGARLPGRSTWPIRSPCWPAPSTTSATAAPHSAPASGGSGLDQGDTRVDEATLRRIHLPGYITAVKAGVGTIMPSYSSWNGVKCSASKRLLTEILKQELGFEGFLISDYNAIDQIAADYKKAVEISINAGMDMVMVPDTLPRVHRRT